MSHTVPIPLDRIEPVADHQVDPARRARLLSSPLLFDVLLQTLAEPVSLDIRRIPHGIIDGKIRVHEARRRGLRSIPALMTIPGTQENIMDIQLACLPSWESEEPEEAAEETPEDPDTSLGEAQEPPDGKSGD